VRRAEAFLRPGAQWLAGWRVGVPGRVKAGCEASRWALGERIGRDGVFRGDATSLTGTSDLKLADAKVAMPAPLHVHVSTSTCSCQWGGGGEGE